MLGSGKNSSGHPMPELAPWDVYRKTLGPFKFGHALWEPNPQLYKRVKLGDVGYILEGRFHLLFSARKQWESQDLGVKVPATFQPLEFEDIIRGSRRPDRLRARTVLEVGGGVRGSATVGPAVEPGAGITFELTKDRGAVLITNHPTYREDIQRRLAFQNYTKKHYQSWVDFSREKDYGDDIRPILVTGVDLTREFAAAAYSDNKTSMSCTFSAAATGVVSASASVWGSWHTERSVHTNCGPQFVHSIQGNRGSSEGFPLESEIPPDDYNQCVFIRYYTVRNILNVIPRVIKGGAGPHQLPVSDRRGDNTGEEGLRVLSYDDSTEVDYQEASDEVVHNVTSDDRDDFDIVAEFIFQRTEAKSVVLHHCDVEDLLREDEEEMMQVLAESGVAEQVEIDENGVGQLVSPGATEFSRQILSLPGDDAGDIRELKEATLVAPWPTSPDLRVGIERESNLTKKNTGDTRKEEDRSAVAERYMGPGDTQGGRTMSSQLASWEVYKKAMNSLCCGEALWEPDPQLYKRVRLGDVGYTRKGRFILLFSAGEPLGSRELGVDVPATFEPLDVGLVVRGVPRMPGSLCTGTVRELGAGVDDSTMTVGRSVEPGARFTFELTGDQGAVLITKHPTYREDAVNEHIFENYTKKHYQSWVDFSRDQGYGRDVRPILVAGVDLTREFATVAYSGNRSRMECRFSPAAPSFKSASASAWGSWHVQGLVHTNCGPPPGQGDYGLSEGSVSEPAIPDEYNQCVFIRYYTIHKVFNMIPKVIKAGAGPHQLPKSDPRGDNTGEEGLRASSDDDSTEIDCPETGTPVNLFNKTIHDVPSVCPERHPRLLPLTDWTNDDRGGSDTVVQFKSQRTEAKSVLMRHLDVQNILQEDEQEIVRVLAESGTAECVKIDENRVGQLVDPGATQFSRPILLHPGSNDADDTGELGQAAFVTPLSIHPDFHLGIERGPIYPPSLSSQKLEPLDQDTVVNFVDLLKDSIRSIPDPKLIGSSARAGPIRKRTEFRLDMQGNTSDEKFHVQIQANRGAGATTVLTPNTVAGPVIIVQDEKVTAEELRDRFLTKIVRV